MPKETYSRLRDAYAIIDGIPSEQFNLALWNAGGKSATDCGTVACAAGWLGLHPDMQRQGLKCDSSSNFTPLFDGYFGFRALEIFFDLKDSESDHLFGGRNAFSDFDPPWREARNLSDKDLWLARVRNFLAQQERAASNLELTGDVA